MMRIIVLLGLTLLTACAPASPEKLKPISASGLAEEYDRSNALVRSQYNGKEIFVRGYVSTSATMPKDVNDQGSVLLEEKGRVLDRQVRCWFSKEQTEEFREVKGDQYVTVKGVFNGEGGMDLKFCKLVRVETP